MNNMNLYFAPLEGITGYIYRNVHKDFFGSCDQYYAPFIVPSDDEKLTKKSLKDILPENNNCKLQVQILTNKSESFLKLEKHVKDLGYKEININLGCPSGTVVSKGRGAGFLKDTDGLDKFLYEVFEKTELAVSVKTRTGFYSGEEFGDLLEIYNKYPLTRLIVHPRVREEYYRGKPDMDVFDYAYKNSKNPLCYNGNVCTVGDFEDIVSKYPSLDGVMIGRGGITNPALFREIRGGAKLTDTELVEFTKVLAQKYNDVLKSETFTLHKLKEVWVYCMENFPENKKLSRAVKKAKSISEFTENIEEVII